MLKGVVGYLRRHHLALVALVVALGGTAYAANQVGSRDIRNGAVRAVDLHRGAVRGNKITHRFTVFRSESVAPGASAVVSVACPSSRRTLYNGAGSWSPGGAGTSLDGLDLSGGGNRGGVTVSGTNASGLLQRLTATAYCLPNH
jgi:hypothetical protein